MLTVEVWGNPLPFIHWFRNGQPIEEAPECQITQVGPPLDQPDRLQPRPVRMTGQLIISETLKDDAGRYTCVAVNDVGQVETEGNLRIIPKREFDRFFVLTIISETFLTKRQIP